MKRFLCLFLFVWHCVPLAQAQISSTKNVDLSLISELKSVKPGESFLIGVHFELDPGWHIYWKNPGDAGLPTRIKFSSNGEFRFSELLWPKPMNFMQPGGIKGIGYEDEVVLMSEVTVPAMVSDDEVEIVAQVNWLLCSETLCVPGRKSLDLELSIGEKKSSSEQGLVQEWRELVP